jgi:hypothetical protein
LKFEKDKLPALSGLARMMKQSSIYRSLEYLAGLWNDGDLPFQLCWYRDHGRTDGMEYDKTVRPATYQAPTWLWASINAAVEFWSQRNRAAVRCDLHFRCYIDGLKSDITLSGPDAFGQVTSGVLSLTCAFLILFQDKEHRIKEHTTFDTDENTTLDLVLLPIISWGSHIPITDRPNIRGIVLELSATIRGQYSRVGHPERSFVDNAALFDYVPEDPDPVADVYVAELLKATRAGVTAQHYVEARLGGNESWSERFRITIV